MSALAAHHCRRRGAVLILVLIAIAAVAVMSAMMLREVAVEYTMGTSVRNTVAGTAAIDSGMLLAADILMQDKEYGGPADTLHEEWAHFPEAAAAVGSEWEGMDLTGWIEDEQGRFPIRALVSDDASVKKHYLGIFRRLVGIIGRPQGMAEADVEQFVDAMRAWTKDPNLGAVKEDRWYGDQDPSYVRPGRKFLYPEEILLVHWENVSAQDLKDLFYGTEDNPGLADMITVWSDGPINMNTAPNAVVKAVCTDEQRGDAFLAAADAYRRNPGSNLATAWPKKLAKEMNLDMTLFPENCLGVTSTLFRVHLDASRGDSVRSHTAVVRATDSDCTVLFQQAR